MHRQYEQDLSQNYDNMMIAYNVDFGSSSMNCIDYYTRSASGVEEINFPPEVIAYPKFVACFINIDARNLQLTNKVTIFDLTGRVFIKTEMLSGKDEETIELKNISTKNYNVPVIYELNSVNIIVQKNQ